MIYALLTTYQRQELAKRTIDGVNKYLNYDGEVKWLIYDDGSGDGYLEPLRDMIKDSPHELVDVYRSEHRGVGHGMNWGIRRVRELGGDLIMILEDDWELREPFNVNPHCAVLRNRDWNIGMIRLGYLSYGLRAEVLSAQDRLWMRFIPNGYQYVYSGHASLRSLAFHDQVGMFSEGLAPGANELDFCAKYNKNPYPLCIAWDLDYGRWGPFNHIGSDSLADVKPEES